LTFDLIIRQLTFLYNNFAYVVQTYYWKKKKVTFIFLIKKAAITIAASVTVFFYMSTDGYDLRSPETFPRQLIVPFADFSPYFPFHQFLRKCHHLAPFALNETCDFVPFPFSFHDVLPH
jgi:hypothetical protein